MLRNVWDNAPTYKWSPSCLITRNTPSWMEPSPTCMAGHWEKISNFYLIEVAGLAFGQLDFNVGIERWSVKLGKKKLEFSSPPQNKSSLSSVSFWSRNWTYQFNSQQQREMYLLVQRSHIATCFVNLQRLIGHFGAKNWALSDGQQAGPN